VVGILERNSLSRGFTLIELLVVVTIIMVVASMLTVGLSRAQRRAETTECMNNLRQIGVTIIAYAGQMGDGILPDFGLVEQEEDRYGVRDQWTWFLDFTDEMDLYFATHYVRKLDPPRKTPALLRCPADVHMFVNSQSMLTSYWFHPENSYRALASISRQNKTILGFEGDGLYKLGGCGCHFTVQLAPEEVDATHFGGGHVLFADGSVKYFRNPKERKRWYFERLAGWSPEQMAKRFGWPLPDEFYATDGTADANDR